MVLGCKWVDEVVRDVPYVMNDEYLRHIIDKYQLDYIVHGDDPCIVDGKVALTLPLLYATLNPHPSSLIDWIILFMGTIPVLSMERWL